MGEGVEFVGEVAEGVTPGLVFGGDAGSAGCADGGGTLGAVIGGGRHEAGAAGSGVGDNFGSIIGGVDDVGFFGVVGDHAGDFGASRPWRRSKKGAIFWCFHKKRKEKRRRKRKEKKEKRRKKIREKEKKERKRKEKNGEN